jgi:hypothetical protein
MSVMRVAAIYDIHANLHALAGCGKTPVDRVGCRLFEGLSVLRTLFRIAESQYGITPGWVEFLLELRIGV